MSAMMDGLDDIDVRMLAALRRNSRISVPALADEVGVSRANAYRRLDRLTDDGVIRDFTIRVDPTRVGRPISVLILISVQQRRWRDIKDTLAALEGVEYLAATTGEFDYLALIRIPDVSVLRDVVLERLHSTPGVVSTRTVFVLDEEHLA
jgi:Lrp/AsnC family transcriptional regulator, leucine-responsive regulatory protein